MFIAVTGATGFLGRELISQLVEKGHQVRAMSRQPDPPEIGPESDLVSWIQGELDDWDSLERLVDGADAVVHTALAREGESFMTTPDDPLQYAQTNLMGSMALLEKAAIGTPTKFVFVSSGAVHQHVVDGLTLDEQHPLRPGALYGACKASMETMVHAYGLSGRINACTVRPVSIYGAEEPIEHSKWFQLVMDVAAGKEVSADGGGKVVHVKDVARAIRHLLAESDSVAGETFNCCDRFISEHEVAQRVMEITGSNANLTGQPKESGREMSTAKLEKRGFRFGGLALLDETIRQYVRAASQA
ncbi:NAD-dependent epimerase/dehydratase family protein [Rhodopirellula halodulae]|uniref:NAD-dependent epimerase/dehydratase family protein n=1 Tax=Rhodopirellula halodulae TaxID=2894198 RepID=UPI001E3F1D3D|nr:NAD-dependent epimerase/dehydratase family protein [Rhodopirellula sp. JC737]